MQSDSLLTVEPEASKATVNGAVPMVDGVTFILAFGAPTAKSPTLITTVAYPLLPQ